MFIKLDLLSQTFMRIFFYLYFCVCLEMISFWFDIVIHVSTLEINFKTICFLMLIPLMIIESNCLKNTNVINLLYYVIWFFLYITLYMCVVKVFILSENSLEKLLTCNPLDYLINNEWLKIHLKYTYDYKVMLFHNLVEQALRITMSNDPFIRGLLLYVYDYSVINNIETLLDLQNYANVGLRIVFDVYDSSSFINKLSDEYITKLSWKRSGFFRDFLVDTYITELLFLDSTFFNVYSFLKPMIITCASISAFYGLFFKVNYLVVYYVLKQKLYLCVFLYLNYYNAFENLTPFEIQDRCEAIVELLLKFRHPWKIIQFIIRIYHGDYTYDPSFWFD